MTGEKVEVQARRAWAPEASTEVAGLLRRLAVSPWLVGGRDDADIAGVRRNESALRAALTRLGWVLIVERDLVRLRKSPPPRPTQWVREAPSPLVCSWFFLIVAAAESLAPRVGLGQLVAAARAAAAEASLSVVGDVVERRAIIRALRELDRRGIVEPIDGDLEGYAHDEQAPVLLVVHHTRLAHVVANPGVLDPAEDPETWLAQAHREDDPARRMRRRLIDDVCVYAADLDDAEAQWLSQRVRGDDGAPLAMAFGLTLERRSEGAAFVVPDEAYRHPHELGPLAFPVPGTVAHAALLLCAHAGVHGRSGDGPGPGWRTLTSDEVRQTLSELAADNTRGRGGWSADLVDDPTLLAARVGQLLEGVNLVRREQRPALSPQLGAAAGAVEVWQFGPATARWGEPGTAPASGRTRRRPAGRTRTVAQPPLPVEASADLFDGWSP